MPVRLADQKESRFAVLGSEDAAVPPPNAGDLERRREIGQFFTPPAVAGFMWDMLEIIHGAKFSRQTRVIDPSCGEGVFLRVAGERGRVASACLFGADIDEALSPSWRRDPLLKGAHLFAANGLLDLPERGVRAGAFDLVVGNPPFAGKGVRDLLRLLDEADAPDVLPETDLFGALVLQERPAPIGPPLTGLERAKLDQLAKTLGRFACWRLTKSAPENGEIEAADEGGAADMFASLGANSARTNGASEINKAAEMVAAWPPKRLLDPKRPETRLLLRRLASTAIEVFFMERFLRLCKPGGLIAVIVPESLVASDQLGPLRTWLLTELDVVAVVSLPQKVFVGVGANARTSVVFARRLLRPRIERAPVADLPESGESDDPDGGGPGQKVLMAAPNTDSPEYSFERYLSDVLETTRANAKDFHKGET